MAVVKRADVPKLIKAVKQGDFSQIYLIFGERFLCQEAADELCAALLTDEGARKDRLQTIDGDLEDAGRTLGLLRTYSLFPGRRLIRVTDTRLFFSKGVAKTFWEKVDKARAANEPAKAGRYLAKMLDLAGLSLDDLDEDITALSASRWKTMFGFTRPQGNLDWVNDLLADLRATGARKKSELASADPAELYIKAFETGIPADNIIILTAEAVDKRKKLYKFIGKNGVILDLSVDSGGSSAARKDQESVLKDLIAKTLAGFNKKMDPRALPVFLERVGFHPVAAVLETEKLALYAGEAPTITREHIDAVIGRTREEALYELTEAITSGRLDQALLILARLQGNGVHPLAILATLRNHLRKLLLVRSFQELTDPVYRSGISYPAFQKSYLPAIKEAREEWPILWKGHPYATYNLFRQAEKYSCAGLQTGLKELLRAEYRLKGSAIPAPLVLDNLAFNLFRG